MRDKPILVVGGGVEFTAAKEIAAKRGDDIEIVTTDELKERGIDITMEMSDKDKKRRVESLSKELKRFHKPKFTPPKTRRQRRKAERNAIKNNRRSS